MTQAAGPPDPGTGRWDNEVIEMKCLPAPGCVHLCMSVRAPRPEKEEPIDWSVPLYNFLRIEVWAQSLAGSTFDARVPWNSQLSRRQ